VDGSGRAAGPAEWADDGCRFGAEGRAGRTGLPGLRTVDRPTVRIRPEIAAYEVVGLVVEV